MQREANIGPHGVPMSEAVKKENAHKVQVDMRVDYVQRALDQRRESDKQYTHQDHSGWIYEAYIKD